MLGIKKFKGILPGGKSEDEESSVLLETAVGAQRGMSALAQPKIVFSPPGSGAGARPAPEPGGAATAGPAPEPVILKALTDTPLAATLAPQAADPSLLAPPDRQAKKADSGDDLMSLFTEETKVDEVLQNLAASLEPVDILQLAQEVAEVAAALAELRQASGR